MEKEHLDKTGIEIDLLVSEPKKIASILGNVVEDKTRSMVANIAKKRYIDSVPLEGCVCLDNKEKDTVAE